MQAKITAVLITRKKGYPKEIFDRITTGFFDEIIIHTECANVYQRYLSAKTAKNEIIYVQDDDALVNYQQLFKKYNGQITNSMTEPFKNFYDPLNCTLVGWGCFFPKSMIKSLEKYSNRYGHDEHLLREADRIFTYLNQPFNTVIMPHIDLFQDEKERMSLDPIHFPSAYAALDKCKLIV